MGFDLNLTASVVLTLCLLYLCYRIARHSFKSSFKVPELLAIASAAMFVSALAVRIIYHDFSGLMHIAKPVLLYDYLRVGGIAFMLSYLGLQIRADKPQINRAPVLLSFLPLLLIIVHPLISHTIVLKETLLKMYLGGSLVIALLYFGLNTFNKKSLTREFSATIVLLVAFLIFVFPGMFIVVPKITYVAVLCLGIIILSNSYS
jgi:hypothetical protein